MNDRFNDDLDDLKDRFNADLDELNVKMVRMIDAEMDAINKRIDRDLMFFAVMILATWIVALIVGAVAK
ncbi:MAG: hypothetical protein LCH57_00910 [Proteobacteria bacterium]|nr:hypothetical protein [Pseudomonadota bacterium]